ncbi:MAG: D-sedoheptulose 7-phosphate isomerase [Saprospiraceae bacterium]|jgi:D-sedoheptulose 7-phosphate isomerase
MENIALNAIKESVDTKNRILNDPKLLGEITNTGQLLIDLFKAGNKLMLCGNGGSAADAQHIAAELSGRFNFDRAPLDAEALHVNASFVTAVANDYNYEEVYKRMVQAKSKKGDALIAISTSGNSPNILAAVHKAKELGVLCIALTGKDGGELAKLCDHAIKIPSDETPRIQESHILIGHILCEMIENNLFENPNN